MAQFLNRSGSILLAALAYFVTCHAAVQASCDTADDESTPYGVFGPY